MSIASVGFFLGEANFEKTMNKMHKKAGKDM